MTKQQIYENAIAPLVSAVFDLCERYGIAFIASFELDETTEETILAHTCRVSVLSNEVLLAMAQLQDEGIASSEIGEFDARRWSTTNDTLAYRDGFAFGKRAD